MKVKVCGIKYLDNLVALAGLNVDMVGFNFYPPSSRYVDLHHSIGEHAIPHSIKKVGVFVNASLKVMQDAKNTYGLDYLQLHGGESPKMAEAAQLICPIIKVFRVTKDFDFKVTTPFEFADLFLFDTHTESYGGSGEKFEWDLISKYSGETAFLLAGGIGPKDSQAINQFRHPQFLGVDINSGFEIEAGRKDASKIRTFLKEIKNEI